MSWLPSEAVKKGVAVHSSCTSASEDIHQHSKPELTQLSTHSGAAYSAKVRKRNVPAANTINWRINSFIASHTVSSFRVWTPVTDLLLAIRLCEAEQNQHDHNREQGSLLVTLKQASLRKEKIGCHYGFFCSSEERRRGQCITRCG